MYENLDKKRLDKQLSIVDKWVKVFKANGTFEGCTGFGKTMIAILAIKRLHSKYPLAKVKVVVPSLNLLQDWISENGHINKWNLKNVEVFVVNTYINSYHNCDLLILDEIHHYVSEEFSKVFNQTTYKFILGLTATLERNDGKHILIEELCPIVESITLEYAKQNGYISNYKTFNLKLNFNEEDENVYKTIHSSFTTNFAKFNFNFSLAMACSMGTNTSYKIGTEFKTGGEWRLMLAKNNDWDGTEEHFWSPRNIAKYAQMWSAAMRNRKNIIYNAQIKIETVLKIVEKFKVKTMIFSETAEFADAITKKLGKICKSYHTKIKSDIVTIKKEKFTKNKGLVINYVEKKISSKIVKDENLRLFKESKEVMVLSTVRSLDEGFDYDKVEMIIMASYNSSKRQDSQRTGRGVRRDFNNKEKCSLIINLYIENTQEEKWLKNKQLGKNNIKDICSVDEISIIDDLGITLN